MNDRTNKRNRRRPRWAALFVLGVAAYAGPALAEAGIVLPVPGGWALREEPQRFDAGNLYTIIDGGAEMFLPYRLQYALFADYTRGTDTSPVVNVEAYAMGSPLDAFGIYSQSRSKNSKPLDIGVPAAVSSTQLLFWKGACFGRITISRKSDDSVQTLELFARALADAFPSDNAPVPELEWLRIDGVAAGTEQYCAKDLFEIPGLMRGLSADVSYGGATARVFIALGDSEEQGRAAYAALKAYFTQRDAKPIEKESAMGTVLLARDTRLLGVAALRVGSFTIGVCQLNESAEAIPLLEKVLAAKPGAPAPEPPTEKKP